MHTLAISRRRLLSAIALALGGLGLLGPAGADPRHDDTPWVGTWATSPQPIRSTEEPTTFPAQTTIRQIVRTSLAGDALRVRLSNEHGSTPLVIGAARVALRSSAAGIVPGTDYPLTFGGQPSVTLAPGAPAVSDPVPLGVPALFDVAVSIYLPHETLGSTRHNVGLQTHYVAPPGGDYTAAPVLPTAFTVLSSYFLTGIEVRASSRAAAVVTLGDSITDGTRSTPDTNSRWPDFLAEQLQAARGLGETGVLNEGISGNRIYSGEAGIPTLARFDRDVLRHPNVRFMTLLIGINDIGNSARGTGPLVTADEIIQGYRQIIARARAHGIRVYGATLTPIGGSGYDFPQAEADRQAVNAWIRSAGEFDAVIDFDAVTRDPARPTWLLPAYDSSDHLHPNDAGYRAMAEAVPLKLFRRALAATD